MSKKELMIGEIEGIVSNFLYYDRKGDEELLMGDIEKLIQSGETDINEIVSVFRIQLEEGLKR